MFSYVLFMKNKSRFIWNIFLSRAVDIWAIGCLIGEMLQGDPIFPGKSDIDQLSRILRCIGKFAEKYVIICKDRCMQFKLQRRLVKNVITIAVFQKFVFCYCNLFLFRLAFSVYCFKSYADVPLQILNLFSY